VREHTISRREDQSFFCNTLAAVGDVIVWLRRIYLRPHTLSTRPSNIQLRTMTDSELVTRIAQGDEPAFLVVYERHGDAIYRVAYRLLGDTGLAEDIRHECFMTFVQRPERFDPARASLQTFLLAITRYLALAARRRRSKREGSGVADDTVPDRTRPDPLGHLLQNELRDRLHTAVASLPVLQREALVLVDCEDLSLAEAAAIVDADIGTVKARLHRARVALRRILRPDTLRHAGHRQRSGA
jgi:RNA polymerase sigma-70 factor (ECF subfamily)